LQQEIASAKAGHKGTISRSNYDFVFLRDQNFGAVPEYVLHIIPKRKEKGLLLGDIWVDAQTYHIRQIVGVPVKSPSFWINDLHITVQFAAVNGMWIPVSVDAIATVRLLGIYTLSGRDLAPPVAASSTRLGPVKISGFALKEAVTNRCGQCLGATLRGRITVSQSKPRGSPLANSACVVVGSALCFTTNLSVL
jgi:hypothetical protein